MLQAATDDVAAGDQTDVTFVLNENSANVTLSDFSELGHNSIFEFTGEKGNVNDVSSWTIDNAQVFGDGTLGVNTDNATLLDISDLGITGFAGLDILDDGNGNARIVSEAQNDEGEVSWEIILTGVDFNDVTAQNFNFA